MNILSTGVKRPKFALTAALLLSLSGVVSWLTMARMEDPEIPERNAILLTVFPGADPEKVERLVAEPIQEHLAEIQEIKTIETTIRAEVAVTRLELVGTLNDDNEIEEIWDQIRRKIRAAQREFPAGVWEPRLDTEILETEAVVLAITGSGDPLVLMEAAEKLKKSLLKLDTVADVKFTADPGDQITIEFDDAQARRLGLDPASLAAQLQARNINLPGGAIRTGTRNTFLRPFAEFRTLEELRQTPILLPSGAAIPLAELARVRRGPTEPASEVMRYNGARAIAVGIVPASEINLVSFGQDVKKHIQSMRPKLAPLQITEITFQPQRVNDRLNGLGLSLLLSVGIVTLVLLTTMGPRLGLIVAGVTPLVAFASVGVFNFAGGILHQMSIAALVIALGLLVDNAIVVAEAVQWHIDRGKDGKSAAVLAVQELAIPLLAATGTTLAAFVPMLLAVGNVGNFTRDIPRVIMLTLAISYFFAMFVTPVMAARFQKPASKKTGRKLNPSLLSRLSTDHPRAVLACIALLVVLSVLTAGGVHKQFFPYAKRNQIIVGIEMPEGTNLQATNETSQNLERLLKNHLEVQSVAAFVGRSAPHFYYNLPKIPNSPHLAQLLVTTKDSQSLPALSKWVINQGAIHNPQAIIIPRIMEQGPPLDAPVEVRIYADSLETLQTRAVEVVALLRDIPGAVNARHNMGPGLPTLRFTVDDAAAGRHQLTRAHVAQALTRQTRGIPAGQFREADDPVPILLRSTEGESTTVSRLASVDVSAPGGKPVPLTQIARVQPEWTPAAIHHHQRSRMVTVSANIEYGAPLDNVMSALQQGLDQLEWNDDLSYQFGGAPEASVNSNIAIATKLPYTLLLLIFILLAEFNSFRKVGIIMITIPLSATGVIPGLLLMNQPFGFMSLLGVLALAGIVVNNAIVLIEVIDARIKEGQTTKDAVRAGVAQRTRPILLTTATTVAGLLPLAFSSSPLWPPMASAMISGLLSSTLLTLLTVPALYLLLFKNEAPQEVPA